MLDALAGSGEMATRIRSFAWANTPLGALERWPISLRSSVGLVLESRFPMALWWGSELRHLYNDAYVPVLGGKHPTALGQPGAQVWSEIWGIVGPQAERVLRGEGATWNEHLRLPMNRRGFLEETYFTFSYSPLRDDGGAIAGVLITCQETTAQVQGERQLRLLRELGAQAALARSARQACAAAAAILGEHCADVPFALLFLNDASSGTAQLAASAGLAQPAAARPEHAPLLRAADEAAWPLAAAQASGSLVIVDELAARVGALPAGPDGRPPERAVVLPLGGGAQSRPSGFLVAGLNPLRALDERYTGLFRLVADQIAAAIASAHAFEAERRRAEALTALDRAKTAFFSNVSHEFRTPLTLLLGPLEDALAEPEPALRGENLQTAHRGALRLLHLVNALLDFSRLEAGRAEAQFEPVDLAQLTTDLASTFRTAAERAGLRMRVSCPALPELVHVDVSMWETIVLNLLSNALKFTFQGEIAVELRPLDTGGVELCVSDTGTGIPSGELSRIFERFHRIEGRRARTHEGSGIGLALVRELVGIHGGEVSAHSELERGTQFRVRLPLGCAHLPPQRVAAAGAPRSAGPAHAQVFLAEALRWLPAAQSAAAADPSLTAQPAVRILLADDNADMRAYLTRLLEPRWSVEAVADGNAALAAARSGAFSLVVSDVMMPGLDGLALLRALRADPATAGIPVLLLSARAGEEARIEGIRSGADDYLTKPFAARELVARVAARLELRRLAAGLEQQRAALTELLHKLPLPVVVLRGPELVFESVNAASTESVHGRELLGRPLLEALPELAGQGFDEMLREVLRTGEAHVGRESPARIARDGQLEERFFSFVCARLRGEEGGEDAVVAVCSEVTEPVRQRARLEQLAAEAASASRAKDEFLAMLGHELRNPLSPIMTVLELMRLRGSQPRDQEILERQVSHLTRLVDDLLDVSRITRGKIELRRREIDVADAIARAVESTQPLLEQREQHLQMNVAQCPLPVLGDPDRLAQVLANLLTNASKYSDRGARISLHATRTTNAVRLSVRDPGIGIAAPMLERIFELFTQQPQTIDRSRGGLGLGLAIVRSLVQMHGGRVAAHSEGPGKGSEFVVELPARSDGAPAHPTAPGSAPSGVPPPERERILVVDDNTDAATTLAEALAELGHAVQLAHDARGALAAASAFRPQIALVDLGLPGMDGYTLARLLAQSSRLPQRLRLIAVTGYGQSLDRERTAAAGFDRHLVKPVRLDELERVVNELSAPPPAAP